MKFKTTHTDLLSAMPPINMKSSYVFYTDRKS